MKGRVSTLLVITAMAASFMMSACVGSTGQETGDIYKKMPKAHHSDHGPFGGNCYYVDAEEAYFCQYDFEDVN